MKSFLIITLPIALVTLLAGLIYMYKTGIIEEMLPQTEAPPETVTSLPEEESDAGKAAKPENKPKLSDVDTSTAEGLAQARDIVRASLETQKREELDRQQRESREAERKKRLYKSMDGWLKRTN